MRNVKIPRGSAELIALSSNIIKKHHADGERSPLHLLQVAHYENLVTRVQSIENQITETRELLTLLIEERNDILGINSLDNHDNTNLVDFVRKSRDVLRAVNEDQEALRAWGFSEHSAKED